MNKQFTAATWKTDQHAYLSQMSGKTICMLYSGGKDSALALYYLSRLTKEYGFALEAHVSLFPTHRYTRRETSRLSEFWHRHQVHLQWHPAPGTDDLLDKTANACLPCQRIRKKWLSQFVADLSVPKNQLVLVVGYSLWDLASYTMEAILERWNPKAGSTTAPSKRLVETAQRFYPLLKMANGYWVYRPMIRYASPAIKTAIKRHRIPLTSIRCRWSDQRPKRNLDGFFTQCGGNMDYDRLLAFANDTLSLPAETAYTGMSSETYLETHF